MRNTIRRGVSISLAALASAGVAHRAAGQDCPPDTFRCTPTTGFCVPHDGNAGTPCCQAVGPDVIVGDIMDVSNYAGNGTTHEAVAFGTTACNVGDINICWISANNQHPVIGQNLFKYVNRDEAQGAFDTFEQIGQSWVKHAFSTFALNQCGCGCNFQDGGVLGVGCSDPYCCGLNGQQGSLGPKWQVNAHTGLFCYPPANPAWAGSIARRLQVKLTDLEPSSTSVLYFAESQYVAFDDAEVGNQDNNASYRRVAVTGSDAAWTFSLQPQQVTKRMHPGIRAWQDHDPSVRETDMRAPNEGLFILACKVSDLGNGRWHYEYALQNLNSHLSGQAFSVPVSPRSTISQVSCTDVDYHSGDGWDGLNPVNVDGTNWTSVVGGGAVTWSTATYTPENEFTANALRWGTMYNFRFDADTPPVEGEVSVSLFRPAARGAVSGTTWVPAAPAVTCFWDQVCGNGDGLVAVEDLLPLLSQWGSPSGSCDHDGQFGIEILDLLNLLASWGPCP